MQTSKSRLQECWWIRLTRVGSTWTFLRNFSRESKWRPLGTHSGPAMGIVRQQQASYTWCPLGYRITQPFQDWSSKEIQLRLASNLWKALISHRLKARNKWTQLVRNGPNHRTSKTWWTKSRWLKRPIWQAPQRGSRLQQQQPSRRLSTGISTHLERTLP